MASTNRRRARDTKGRFKKKARRGKKKTTRRKTKRKNPTGVVVRTTAEGVNVTRNRRAGRKAARGRARDSKGRFKKGRGRSRGRGRPKARRNPSTGRASSNPPTALERLQDIPRKLGFLALPALGSAVVFRLDERVSNRAIQFLRIPGTTDRAGQPVAPMDTALGKGVRAVVAIGLGMGVNFLLPNVEKLEMSPGDLVSFALLTKLAAEVLQDNVEPLIPGLREPAPAVPARQPAQVETPTTAGFSGRRNGRRRSAVRGGMSGVGRSGLGAVGRLGIPVELPGPRF